MEILRSYTFQLISIGTLFLAVASAIVGSLNLYKGQSLIGDAIGHSSFPGIVLIFMVFQTRNPNMLFVWQYFCPDFLDLVWYSSRLYREIPSTKLHHSQD